MRVVVPTLILGALATLAEPAVAQEAPFTFEGEVLVQNASAFSEIEGYVVCKICRGPACPPDARLEDTFRRPDDPSNVVVALGAATLGRPRGGGNPSALEEVVPFTVRILEGGLPPRYDSGWPVPLTEADSYVCYLELFDPATESAPRDERDYRGWGAPFVPTVGNPAPVRNAVGGAPTRVIASGPIP